MSIERSFHSTLPPAPFAAQADLLCDEFEAALQRGESPTVASFAARIDETARGWLVQDLLRTEYSFRRERNLPVDHDTLAQGFAPDDPHFAAAWKRIVGVLHYDGAAAVRARHVWEVSCPACGAETTLPDDDRSADVRCLRCEKQFRVHASMGIPGGSSAGRIGRFELLEYIDSGGFGDVWKAYDTALERTVAIKLPRSGSTTRTSLREMLREARKNARLNHPDIVRVHEVVEDDEVIAIVSDYVDGESLASRMRRGRIPDVECAQIAIRVAMALHHAHLQGIVHRDVKPANILLDQNGSPRLIDFGLARIESGETLASIKGVVKGTLQYMPPEQAQGTSHLADGRADVYSLGVVLFEMLTSERPFRGSDIAILKAVVECAPPSPRLFRPNLAKDLETIILKCLEKEPSQRYASAAALADELARYLERRPILARPVSSWERVYRWGRRRPAIAALSLSLAASLVIGLATALLQQQRLREQLAQTLLQTAELQGRRGDWNLALTQIVDAERLGASDQTLITLKKIEAFDAINDGERSGAYLNQLRQLTDLGDHETTVLFLDGMDRLVKEGVEKARPLFASAYSKKELAPWRREMIDAMLAESADLSVAHLQKAVDLNPFGSLPRRYYVLMLLLTGRLEEASEQASVAELLFPADPGYPLMQALIAISDQRSAQAQQFLQSPALRQMDPVQLARLQSMLSRLPRLNQLLAEMWDLTGLHGARSVLLARGDASEGRMVGMELPGSEDLAWLGEFQGDIVKLLTMIGGSSIELVDAQQLRKAFASGPLCQVRAFEPMADLFSLRTRGFLREGKGSVERIDDLIERLAVASVIHSDAFLAYSRGQLLFVRGRLSEAADAFAEASTRRSAFLNVAQPAAFAAARCAFALYGQGKADQLAIAVRYMRQTVSSGTPSNYQVDGLLEIALAGGDYESARTLVSCRQSRRGAGDVELQLADVDFRAGNFQQALERASSFSRQNPGNETAERLVRNSASSLRKLMEESQ